MTEYDVKKALSGRSGQVNQPSAASQQTNGIPNSVLADVFSGKRGATSEMMGRRQDLAPGLAAKMSQAFGMDFSAVQLYRSDAMAGTELHGMAQGDKVVLSSDVDLNTLEGQAILGHELSHIRAQSMGMGTGRSGLLESAALEHQADSEGMLAARGMNISGERMGMSMGLGMAGMEGLTPVGGGLGASAAAPMQAEKIKDSENASGMLNQLPWTMGDNDYNLSSPQIDKNDYFEDASKLLINDIDQNKRNELIKKLSEVPDINITFSSADNKERVIQGLGQKRIAANFIDFWAKDHDNNDVVDLLADLTAGTTRRTEDGTLEAVPDADPADPKYDEAKLRGVNKYKNILYHKLKTLESEFGSILTQMHPRDIFERMGAKKIMYYSVIMQDAQQLTEGRSSSEETKQLQADHTDNKARDDDMLRLVQYYNPLFSAFKFYGREMNPELDMGYQGASDHYMSAKKKADGINGPHFSPQQQKWYDHQIRKKIKSGAYEETPENLKKQYDAEYAEYQRRRAAKKRK